MRYFAIFLFVFSVAHSVSAQRVTRGIVLDQNENPLHNVKIQEPSTQNIAYTDNNGEFILTYFEQESKIIFTYPQSDTVRLALKYDTNTKVFMKPKKGSNEYHLGYHAGFLDFGNKNKNKNLENMPYFLGESDVNRQLQMLPGVEQGNEGYSNLYVRGGNVDQNLMLYNGTPIYNFNHIFGISSTFHHKSIKNTSIYRGIAPAKFGGRSSAIINLESEKDKDFSGLEGEFEMTPLNAGLYLGKIKKGVSYFTIAARRSWIDLLIPQETRQNSQTANIYDLQVNYGRTLKNKDKLDFSLMSTRDLYFLAASDDGDTSGSVVTRFGITQKWSNLLASVKYTNYVSKRFSGDQSLYYSSYKTSLKLEQEIYDPSINSIPSTQRLQERGIRDIGIQSNWVYHWKNNHNVSFGLQNSTKLFLVGRRTNEVAGYPSVLDSKEVSGDEKYKPSNELVLHAEDAFRLNPDTKLDYGFRSVLYQYNGRSRVVLEPRIHGTFFLDNRDVLKLGYNRHNQFISQLSLGNAGSPQNLWVPATEEVLPLKVDVLEAAYERKLGNDYSASINVYFKRMQNITLVSNLEDAGNADLDWQASVVQGTGRAYGAELFLQRSKGFFTGWISYAYSRSTRNFPELFDEDFDFSFDRPHMLKIYGNYTNKSSQFNFGFNYMIGSGQLFTLPIGKFRDQSGNLQLEYNTLNNYRSNVYQRFDISVMKAKYTGGLDQEWRFYIYNMLGSRNPLNISPDFENAGLSNLVVNRVYLAFVPGIAYIVKF